MSNSDRRKQTGATVRNYLAKVGVEGSNPFARSNIENARKPRKTAAFRISEDRKDGDFEGPRRREVTTGLHVQRRAEFREIVAGKVGERFGAPAPIASATQ